MILTADDGPPRRAGRAVAPGEAGAGPGVAELTVGRLAAVDGHEGAALGLVLTGGYRPRPAVIDAIRRADLFATLVADDTYAVASEVHDLLVKTHPADREKIELIKALVAEHLDIDRILGVAATGRCRVR